MSPNPTEYNTPAKKMTLNSAASVTMLGGVHESDDESDNEPVAKADRRKAETVAKNHVYDQILRERRNSLSPPNII